MKATALVLGMFLAGAAGWAAVQPVLAAQGLPARSGEIRAPYRNEEGRIVPMPPDEASPQAPAELPQAAPAVVAPPKNSLAEPALPGQIRDVAEAAPPPEPETCDATPERPGAVTIENVGDGLRPAGPATFGIFFRKGLVADSVAADGMPSQIDVKRRWNDGSLKHAVMTVALPELATGTGMSVNFVASTTDAGSASAPSRQQVIDALPPLSVNFRIHDGPQEQSTLSRAEPQLPDQAWLEGKEVVEYLLRDVPVDTAGNPDPDLEVRYHVRHYPNSGTTRIAVVVENTKWTAPGNLPYDVTIRVGDKDAFAKSNVGSWPKKGYIGHPRGSRWVKRFWIGPALDDFHVRYDVACIVRSGLLPHYVTSAQISSGAIQKLSAAWRKSDRDILENGLITPYFPTTGGRREIGPLPTWAALYLLSQDRDAWEVTKGIGDLSGSVNVHLRDPKTGLPVSLDDYPGYSLNRNGTAMKTPLRDASGTPWVKPAKSYFSPDSAHQGSFAYVPYLMTGDYYYFEEVAFWANYNMLAMNHRYRSGEKGLLRMQLRGIAWSLRNLLHAAALAPDGSWAKSYFEAKLMANIEDFRRYLEKPDKSPLGVFRTTHAYTRGWDRQWKDRYESLPPWQHNFLVWTLAHTVDQGYEAAAPFRDFLMRLPVGLVIHPDEISPHAASAYFLFVGENVDKTKVWASTWKEIDRLTYDAPAPEKRNRPRKSGGDYSRILRGVLAEAVRAGVPGAESALAWIESQMPKIHGYYRLDPTWALSP